MTVTPDGNSQVQPAPDSALINRHAHNNHGGTPPTAQDSMTQSPPIRQMSVLHIKSRDAGSFDVSVPRNHTLTVVSRSIDYNINMYILLMDDHVSAHTGQYACPPHRLDSNQHDTTTYISRLCDTRVRVVYDNKQSMMRSKRVVYSTSIEMIDASNTVNARAIIGANLFMDNHVFESERYFKENGSDTHTIFALAYAAMSFLRAMMTWDKDELADAAQRLKDARTLVTSRLHQASSTNIVGSIGRNMMHAVGLGNDGVMSVEQIELELIGAESLLLQSQIGVVTEESLMAMIRAGVQIRAAYKTFHRLYIHINQPANAAVVSQLDTSVTGGIQFGVGVFNLMFSAMPPVILKLIAFLGFPCDRALGFKLLNQCIDGDGLRAPLAALLLLCWHVIGPSFYTIRLEYHNQRADSIMQRVLAKHPTGALFLWLKGRMQRTNKQLSFSVATFTFAASQQVEWVQLQHLMAYELAWSTCFARDYTASLKHWQLLYTANNWSKATFAYMMAVLLLDIVPDNLPADPTPEQIRSAQNDAARPYMTAALSECGRQQIAGKTLSIGMYTDETTMLKVRHIN